MRQVNVEVGGRYVVRVSGFLVVVRVLGVERAGRGGTRYVCQNEHTGREIKCSARRLRARANPAALHTAAPAPKGGGR